MHQMGIFAGEVGMLLIPGRGKGEGGTGKGERGRGNGERGTGKRERGTGNGERGRGNREPGNRETGKPGNGKRETGNGKPETGNGKRETGNRKLVYSGNPLENSKWRSKQKKRLEEKQTIWVNVSFYRLCPQMASTFLQEHSPISTGIYKAYNSA